MERNWDLIRSLLRAIDIDYSLEDRLRLIEALAEANGAKCLNYHLCLIYEAGLARYSRPFYSEDSHQLEVEPIYLSKQGINLFRLMCDDDAWTEAKQYLDTFKPSNNILVRQLRMYFLSTATVS